jgi:hypothetical protein
MLTPKPTYENAKEQYLDIVDLLRARIIIPLCIKYNLIYSNSGRKDFFHTQDLSPVDETDYSDLGPILTILRTDAAYGFCLGNLIDDVHEKDCNMWLNYP